MTNINADIPISEQEVCVTCGLCCDGTLFYTAELKPGERVNLPEKIAEQYSQRDNGEIFTLPCPYFCGSCTIYNQKRAYICGSFRCQLLKNFSNNRMTQADSIQIVAKTKQVRTEVFQLYTELVGTTFSGSFMQLLEELPKFNQTYAADNVKRKQFNMLVIKCGILDTLLTKTFRSPESFDALIKSSMS